MKSAHRHELQTNALAQRLDVAIERLRPYVSTIVGVIVAVVVLFFIWTYVSNSSAGRHGEAWDAYHQAVGSVPPNLSQLHSSAQEYPGTKMQELADVTWADGQVYQASESYIYNRPAAEEALKRARNTYQSILQSSDDDRLKNRAHLGMARVYEMRNELEKAREEYLKVGGGYAEFAKLQAERLAEPEAVEAYAWLAKAEPPRLRAPAGLGTPGQRPDFSVGELDLPGEAAGSDAPDAEAPDATRGQAESFDELLKTLQLPETTDRYDAGEQAPATDGSQPANDPEAAPPATQEKAADDEPADEEPAAEESSEEKPVE